MCHGTRAYPIVTAFAVVLYSHILMGEGTAFSRDPSDACHLGETVHLQQSVMNLLANAVAEGPRRGCTCETRYGWTTNQQESHHR